MAQWAISQIQTPEEVNLPGPSLENAQTEQVPTQETLPRRSKRSNIGIPPDKYHDPSQKRLNVEHEKQKRDAKRAEKLLASQEGNAKALLTDNTIQVDITSPLLVEEKPLHAKDVDLPTSFKQAQRSPFWEEWKLAMEQQLDDLAAKKTWTLILKPLGVKILLG